MANTYSIEIQGRFNSAQIQQELNKVTASNTPGVEVRVNVKDINKLTQITDGTKRLTKEITEYNAGLAKTVIQTQVVNKETGELVTTEYKLITNEKELQKLRDTQNQKNIFCKSERANAA